MKKRKGLELTLEEADAHQRKHGFAPLIVTPTRSAEEQAHAPKSLRNVRKRAMNRTEREFSLILEARKRTGEIHDWKFEGVRLLWGGGMTYTGDFTVKSAPVAGVITIIEVKGGHIRDRDIVRFKGCRHEWQEWFDFEFHQRRKGEWYRLL